MYTNSLLLIVDKIAYFIINFQDTFKLTNDNAQCIIYKYIFL